METELMHLSWNEFQNSANQTFRNLQGDDNFTDVTLACVGGKQVKAHKVILSSSSEFFKDILIQNPHQCPVIYLKGVDIEDLKYLLKFIYSGEVEIPNENLEKFLDAANDLKVSGLLQKTAKQSPIKSNNESNLELKKAIIESKYMEAIESKIKRTSIYFASQTTADNGNPDIKQEKYEHLPQKIDDKYKEDKAVTFNNHTNENGDEAEIGDFDTTEETKETKIQNVKVFENEPWNVDVEDGEMSESYPKADERKRSHSCDVCLKEFTTLWSAQEHRDAVHDNIRYLCDLCEHSASSKRNLRGHIGKKHQNVELPTTYTKIDATKLHHVEYPQSSTTININEAAATISTNENTLDLSSKEIESIDGKNSIEHEINEKLDNITNKVDGIWTCLECGKTDNMKFHLRRHAETHLEGYEHQCLICSKVYKTRSSLKIHVFHCKKGSSLAKSEDGRFSCDQCDATSKTPSALRIHKYRYHSMS